VLARDDRDEQEPDDLVLAEEARLERPRDLRQPDREGRPLSGLLRDRARA
jgi:hypothetical protein